MSRSCLPERNKLLVNESIVVGSQGEGFDVQCGRSTEVTVVNVCHLHLSSRQRTVVGRSVAEVKAMAPRQQVCAVVGRVVHVSQTTETVEFHGASIESQSCYIEDNTGTIKVQLWESLIGKLAFESTYKNYTCQYQSVCWIHVFDNKSEE